MAENETTSGLQLGGSPVDRLYLLIAKICGIGAIIVGCAALTMFLVRLVVPAEDEDYENRPVVETAQQATTRDTCSLQLQRIGLALKQYQDTYETLPPAYVLGDSGEPAHSWRVLLLPFLDQKELYGLYRFDEPWNGPNNQQLAAKMPDVYRCPGHEDNESNETTDYVAVVGELTAWPGAITVPSDEITDPPSKTILVVEANQLQVPWMAPQDLQYSKMGLTFRSTKEQGLSSAHVAGSHILMVDGNVEFLSDEIEVGALRQLLEIADGKPELEPDKEETEGDSTEQDSTKTDGNNVQKPNKDED